MVTNAFFIGTVLSFFFVSLSAAQHKKRGNIQNSPTIPSACRRIFESPLLGPISYTVLSQFKDFETNQKVIKYCLRLLYSTLENKVTITHLKDGSNSLFMESSRSIEERVEKRFNSLKFASFDGAAPVKTVIIEQGGLSYGFMNVSLSRNILCLYRCYYMVDHPQGIPALIETFAQRVVPTASHIYAVLNKRHCDSMRQWGWERSDVVFPVNKILMPSTTEPVIMAKKREKENK
jgi:hypothetical protein